MQSYFQRKKFYRCCSSMLLFSVEMVYQIIARLCCQSLGSPPSVHELPLFSLALPFLSPVANAMAIASMTTTHSSCNSLSRKNSLFHFSHCSALLVLDTKDISRLRRDRAVWKGKRRFLFTRAFGAFLKHGHGKASR